jgi:ABC-2 type transport system permease protein
MQTRFWLKPIFSVAWKDILIFVRYKTFFVAVFLWPIIFPFTSIFLGKGLAGRANEGISHFAALSQTPDFSSFLIIGNLIWMFVNINLWMGGLSLKTDRDRGTFDTHWSTPVNRISLVLGATIASLFLNFLPMVVSIIFFKMVGLLSVSGNIIEILAVLAAILPFLIGFTFAFSALTLRIREAGMVVQIMRTLFSVLCGMQFPLAVLPVFAQNIGQWIPLTHFVSILRGILINGAPLSDFGSSFGYIILSGAVMCLIGVLIFEFTKFSIRRNGLVSGY